MVSKKIGMEYFFEYFLLVVTCIDMMRTNDKTENIMDVVSRSSKGSSTASVPC